MRLPRPLHSPLAATAGVIAGMGMLAIPMRRLTSAPPMPAPTSVAPSAATDTAAWVTLRLLKPATSVKLETPGGKVLWKLNGVPAGDTDTRIPVPLEDGELDVTLEVRFGHPAGDTAVFLTIAPDGLEEETRYAIGSEHVEEPLTFSWPGR